MTQGKLDPRSTPSDGLTARQRRIIPIAAMYTGPEKGKSTAAFGMAMHVRNRGMNIGALQLVRSAKQRVGEEVVIRRLDEPHNDTEEGDPIEWHKMGEGWSWSREQGTEKGHAVAAAEGWQEIRWRLENEAHDFYVLDEFAYPIKQGWVDVDDAVETLKNCPDRQHVVMTGRDADPKLVEVTDLVAEMTKIKHPTNVGRKG